MGYSDFTKIIKTVMKTIIDPNLMTSKPKKSYMYNSADSFNLNNNVKGDIFAEPEQFDIEYNRDNSMNDVSFNKEKQSNNNDEFCDISQGNSSNSQGSQGVIDSIANELTSVKLQQAIILSEIVGKPRSKTRKRRF